jgi:hypothetical protein
MDSFWNKVNKTSGCWIWTAANKDGYGRYSNSGYAHRISWEMHFGKIPAGMFVCHKCDNPPCVNPDHLFLGTNQDNVNDMRAKGRGSKPPPMGGWNKFTYPNEIIQALGKESDTKIAIRACVSKHAIQRERKRRGIPPFPSETQFKKGDPHPRWSKKGGL